MVYCDFLGVYGILFLYWNLFGHPPTLLFPLFLPTFLVVFFELVEYCSQKLSIYIYIIYIYYLLYIYFYIYLFLQIIKYLVISLYLIDLSPMELPSNFLQLSPYFPICSTPVLCITTFYSCGKTVYGLLRLYCLQNLSAYGKASPLHHHTRVRFVRASP